MPGGVEYERRFLVSDLSGLPEMPAGVMIVQGYLTVTDGTCIRVRRTYHTDGTDNFVEEEPTLTYKGARVNGARTEDFVFIDRKTAAQLFRLAQWRIVKLRHSIVHANDLWDIDVFLWENEGLVIAECEGTTPMTHVKRPAWCKEEITSDLRYNNEALAINPWRKWDEHDN